MISDKEILEIVSEHLCCNVSVMDYSGKEEDILKFARAMFDAGCEYATSPGMWPLEQLAHPTPNPAKPPPYYCCSRNLNDELLKSPPKLLYPSSKP